VKRILLKQKLALSLSIIGIFSLVLISITVFLYINKILIDNKKAEVLSNTISQAHEESLIFKYNELFSYMLADRVLTQDVLLENSAITKSKLLDSFKEYTEKDKRYLAIYLLDEKGMGLVSTDPRFVGQDYSFRDYFKKAINGKPYVDVAIGSVSKQFGYYFSTPVFSKDENSVIGVVVLKVDPSFINIPIINSEIAKNNTVMLVDDSGIVLYSNEENRDQKSLGTLTEKELNNLKVNNRFLGKEIIPLGYDTVQQSIRNYDGPVVLNFFDKLDNDNEIMSLIRLDEYPFYMVTEIRLADANTQVFNTVATIVLILLIILTIISFIIYVLMVSFIRPVDKFMSYFSQISKGDFTKEIQIETKDEFYDLALSVNKMSKNLSDLYNNLDEKVKEQTLKINNKVVESENQNKAILNILEDVEKEKDYAESMAGDLKKFQLAVENASDQIVITDLEGLVIYGNKAVEKITGYSPSEALGKKAGILWSSPMSEAYYSNMWDIIKNQKKPFVGEIVNKRKNGDVYTAIISISSVLNKKGEIIYFVAIERDITKEKEVDRAKTEFVSLASHQLRTPLSAINWYTEMLIAGDAGAVNEEQKKYLEEIAIGNKRMVDLVDDLLNVSRLDMGTFVMDLKDINILDLVKNVLKEAQSQILEKKQLVEEVYGEDIPIFPADEKLIRMIFQNLLSNAIKYTNPEGHIKINLSRIKKGENFGDKTIDDESLAFSVSDSGMGIPIGQQDRIFSKLFRADNAKESETEGTGLGLYVVKSIVDQAGGSLWFKSEQNKGSTFYIIFPIGGMKIKEKKDTSA
jgi:PAS domain S-box-containing protein